MKISKSEVIYLILSLLFLLGSIGLYITYGDKNTVNAKQTASWKQEALADFTKEAETLVKQLEDNPNEDLLADTRVAVKRVTDTQIRQKLNERVATIETLINQLKVAEEAVTKLEAEPIPANIDSAQAAIDAIPLTPKKTELQNRIDTVRNNLAAQQTATPAVQATQPAEPAATIITPVAPEPAISETPATE